MFAYQHLKSERERELYRIAAEAIAARAVLFSTRAADEPLLPAAINAVLTDYPHFFWFEGRVAVKKENGVLLIRPFYVYDESSVKKAEAQIEALRDLLTARDYETEYEKAKAVFDLLTDRVAYSGENGGQNLCNALVEKRAVCRGISKAYQYLLSELGVFATTVAGFLNGSRHEWNLVRIDGAYYHADLSLSGPAFDFLFPAPLRADRHRTFLVSDGRMTEAGVAFDPSQRRPPCPTNHKEKDQ